MVREMAMVMMMAWALLVGAGAEGDVMGCSFSYNSSVSYDMSYVKSSSLYYEKAFYYLGFCDAPSDCESGSMICKKVNSVEHPIVESWKDFAWDDNKQALIANGPMCPDIDVPSTVIIKFACGAAQETAVIEVPECITIFKVPAPADFPCITRKVHNPPSWPPSWYPPSYSPPYSPPYWSPPYWSPYTPSYTPTNNNIYYIGGGIGFAVLFALIAICRCCARMANSATPTRTTTRVIHTPAPVQTATTASTTTTSTTYTTATPLVNPTQPPPTAHVQAESYSSDDPYLAYRATFGGGQQYQQAPATGNPNYPTNFQYGTQGNQGYQNPYHVV
eukprot:TRINITY_DN17437_c0_g2_i1.p2 TRINITY_DN17437_c0_g2~~TRINITY_DN17437_c0_g2_i1.p2  ORF type:complete len:332 (+),score=39.50 TRINITY_DN17437_c0_g2_i1:27-1022(+)